MPVELRNRHVRIYRLNLSLEDFPVLLWANPLATAARKLHTLDVEAMARRYVNNGFRADDTEEFVNAVCRWGGRAAISGKVARDNTWPDVATRLASGYKASVAGRQQEAIETIDDITGLDVSFGSKHLKFLHPEGAVVLDSIISENLGFPLTSKGYSDFLAHCLAIRDMLNERAIGTDPFSQEEWRVSDVEMAIFTHIRS